jgi:ABC-2 type transport system ATP-binding protein
VLRELVSITSSSGITIFFSSHQLSEVELIADHVGIVDHGRMVVSGCLDDLKARYQRVHVVLESGAEPPVRWPEGAESIHQEGRVVSMLCSHNAEAIVEQARSIPGATVERFPVTLKEIFLEHVRSN